jgi:saccharopine dehydrogenase-like NADP-dependent oxidoreductase
MKMLILGCGNVGYNVAMQIIPRQPDINFMVADIDLAIAQDVADKVGCDTQAVRVDINDASSLDQALVGVDLVFNAVGPFYRSAVAVIEAAIKNRVNYMDINDDHDVASELLFGGPYHQRAQDAGIQLIIGCGSTPGLTNVVAKMLVDSMDQADSIHLSTVVPFVPQTLSPAVVEHMLHITAGDVVQFKEGEYCLEKGWGGCRDVPYKAPIGNRNAYFIGHGETVTLPHFIEGLKTVTNRIGFFPEQGNDIWRSFIELGFDNKEVIDGANTSPLQFMINYLPSPAASDALQVDLSQVPKCVGFRIEVEGTRQSKSVTAVMEYHLDMTPADDLSSTADPTPICARLALEAFIRGDIKGLGLLSPEMCLDADKYVRDFSSASGARFILEENVIADNCFKDL